MQTVRVEIPADLVATAGLDAANLSAEAAGTAFRSIMAPVTWRRIAARWNGSACDRRF
jgi:hypothetical protein